MKGIQSTEKNILNFLAVTLFLAVSFGLILAISLMIGFLVLFFRWLSITRVEGYNVLLFILNIVCTCGIYRANQLMKRRKTDE